MITVANFVNVVFIQHVIYSTWLTQTYIEWHRNCFTSIFWDVEPIVHLFSLYTDPNWGTAAPLQEINSFDTAGSYAAGLMNVAKESKPN